MSAEEGVLEVAAVASHAELSILDNPQDLELVYMPAISLILERAIEIKGGALSDDEIQRIRAASLVQALPRDVADAVISERGGLE